MKNLLLQCVLLCVACIAPATAQNDTLGWGRNSAYNRTYNPQTVVEIDGEITAINYISPRKGMSTGVHLMVRTSTENIAVHLGPQWYIDRQNFQFQKGDKVEVKGSKVMLDGQNIIIAIEVEKAGKKLKLRNKNGIPNWSWRGRGRLR